MKKIKNRVKLTKKIATEVPEEGYSMRDILAILKGSNPAIVEVDVRKFISNAVRDKWLKISCKAKDIMLDMDAKVIFKREVPSWLNMDMLKGLFPKTGEFNRVDLYNDTYKTIIPSLSKMDMALQRLLIDGHIIKHNVGSNNIYSWGRPATLDSFKEKVVVAKKAIIVTNPATESSARKEFNTGTLLIKAEDDIWQARPQKVDRDIYIYHIPKQHIPFPMELTNNIHSILFKGMNKLSTLFGFKNSIEVNTKGLRDEYHTANGHGILMTGTDGLHYLATTSELPGKGTWMRLLVQE